MLVSKTAFLKFLDCPKNVWLKLHRPELADEFELSDFAQHLVDQGNDVETHARLLFPEGVEVKSKREDAQVETSALIQEETPVIFQATFIADGFIAKADVFEFDTDNKCWNVYEVKGSNSVKEEGPSSDGDHISDLAFQASVMRRAGIPAGKFFLIHLNKAYIRSGDLDLQSLFTIEDETEKVAARIPEIEPRMEGAREYLNRENEPVGNCDCLHSGRSGHCETFHISNPGIPDYGVHDIARISAKKLVLLMERKIYTLDDLPSDFDLTEIQKNQVMAHKSQKPHIDTEAIKSALEEMLFPLYFFDYESFGLAIPPFDGYAPYKKIPFQFSLHILREPDGELEHVEYLHTERTDPTQRVAELLDAHIQGEGSVIVWNKVFEEGVNKQAAERSPAHASVFERVNTQLYDLMDVFRKQHYVHHGFRGSVSLKKVLPALVPAVTYNGLGIQEGGAAADAWWRMISSSTLSAQEREQIAKDLRIYCGVDTVAMYHIWKHLREKVA